MRKKLLYARVVIGRFVLIVAAIAMGCPALAGDLTFVQSKSGVLAAQKLSVYRRSTPVPLYFPNAVTISRTLLRNLPAIAFDTTGFETIVAVRDLRMMQGTINQVRLILTPDAVPPLRFPSYRPLGGCPPIISGAPIGDGTSGCQGGGPGLYDVMPWGSCFTNDCGWGGLNSGGEGQVVDIGSSGSSCNYNFLTGAFSSCYIGATFGPPTYGRNLFITHTTSYPAFSNACINPKGKTNSWFVFFYQGLTFAIGVSQALPIISEKNIYAPYGEYIAGEPATLNGYAYADFAPFSHQYLGWCDYSGL